MSQQPRVAIVAGLAVLGMGMASFVLLGKSSDAPPPGVEPAAAAAVAAPPTPRATVAEVPAPPTPVKPKLPQNPKLDREASDRMREQIHQSLGQQGGSMASREADPAGPREDGAKAEELPLLDKDYIRERIKDDLLPVAIECYESALEDDPKLAGKVVMSFAIVGDPDVGGVVDEASVVGEQSTLANEFVRECMRESLMAVSFEAPADGGRVEVTYPFMFEPGEEE